MASEVSHRALNFRPSRIMPESPFRAGGGGGDRKISFFKGGFAARQVQPQNVRESAPSSLKKNKIYG